MAVRLVSTTTPLPPRPECEALGTLLRDGVTWGDSEAWLPALPADSIDLWFTSPPYVDARPYSRIHPDRYVEWFLPYSKAMLLATKRSGWFVLNIKNRVARSGPLTGQRHPYVYQLVLALQHQGWRWIETYIWVKPNAVPGRFGPRTKDSFEYVYAFTKGPKPYFDLESVRVPYRTTADEIERRKFDANGRRNTGAGFGRDRTKTYLHGGADPGNVVSVPQTYNEHRGVAHTAAMPEGRPSSSSGLARRSGVWSSTRSPVPGRPSWLLAGSAVEPAASTSTPITSRRRSAALQTTLRDSSNLPSEQGGLKA